LVASGGKKKKKKVGKEENLWSALAITVPSKKLEKPKIVKAAVASVVSSSAKVGWLVGRRGRRDDEEEVEEEVDKETEKSVGSLES